MIAVSASAAILICSGVIIFSVKLPSRQLFHQPPTHWRFHTQERQHGVDRPSDAQRQTDQEEFEGLEEAGHVSEPQRAVVVATCVHPRLAMLATGQ